MVAADVQVSCITAVSLVRAAAKLSKQAMAGD
jgi:hypothetical protein